MSALIAHSVWTRTVEHGAALLLLLFPVLGAYAERRGRLPSLDRLTLARTAPVSRRRFSSLPHLLAVADQKEPHAYQRRGQRCRLMTDLLVAELANHWRCQQQLRRTAQQQLVAARQQLSQQQLSAASRRWAPGAGEVSAAGASTQLAARAGGQLALAAASRELAPVAAELAATTAGSSAGQRSSPDSAAHRHLASSRSSGALRDREPALA